MVDRKGSGDEKKTGPGSWNLGTWIVMGVGVGTILSVVLGGDFVTGMGIGIGLGVVVGAYMTFKNRGQDGG